MSHSPLSFTAPRTRFQPWPGWLVFSAALVVAAGVAVTINRLREHADECRRVQTDLAFLQADAHEIDALEWETIFRKKLNEESSERLEKIKTRMQERISRLDLLGSSLPRLEEATKRYLAYVPLVDQEFKLLTAAKFKEAEEFDAAKVDPAFDALETTLEEMGHEYDRIAIRTLGLATTSTLLVLLSGVGLIAGLVWQFNKKRRAAEVAAATQRALRQANENLESRVRERTAELSTLNKQMESRVTERTRELQQTNHNLEAEVGERERAQSFLNSVIENLPMPVFIKEAKELRFVLWNKAGEKLTGIPNAQMIGKNDHDLFPQKDAELYVARDRAAFEKRSVLEIPEEIIQTRDRGARTTHVWKVPIFDATGQPAFLLEISEDITERKQAEETLQRLRDQHALILNSVGEGVLGLNLDGQITFENPASAAMLGCEITDLIGRPAHVAMHHTRPDGTPYPQSECPIHATLRDGLVRRVKDEVFWRKNGTSFPVEYTSAPLHDENGRIIGATVVFTDISERKRAQGELENVHKKLLEASRRGGMAEIATNVLHNVGNVLNSVNVSTSLIVQSVKKFPASGLARVVALLQDQAQDLGAFITRDSRGKHLPAYLAQLSEHLLGEQAAIVSELDSLRRNVEHIKEIVAMQQNYAKVGGVKEMINVVNLVEDSLRMNEGAFNRHCVEIIRKFETVPPMNIEKHKILQILVNLLRNAKHACQDSVRMDKRLTVRVANGEGRIRISVMDNGVGIPPENLTRIFNHGFTTRKDGHGFGLHSGALAAKEMGGSLTVRSDGPGQGAEFTLELPCDPPSIATFSTPNASANTHEIHADA
jgi:PAS domain S-box-containing protein